MCNLRTKNSFQENPLDQVDDVISQLYLPKGIPIVSPCKIQLHTLP